MSAQPHVAPLYAVPNPNKPRFAALLMARSGAAKTLNRVAAAPRAALGYVLRLGQRALAALPLGSLSQWVLRGGTLAQTVLRTVGTIPALLTAAASPTVQNAVRKGVSWLARGLRAAGRLIGRGVTSLLNRCGGQRVAVQLTQVVARVQAKVAQVSAVVLPRVRIAVASAAFALHAARPLIRAVVLHRVLGAVVAARAVRVVLEVLAAPFLIDASPVARVKARLARTAAPPVTATEVKGQMPLFTSPTPKAEPTPPAEETPSPVNRAERREAARQRPRTA